MCEIISCEFLKIIKNKYDKKHTNFIFTFSFLFYFFFELIKQKKIKFFNIKNINTKYYKICMKAVLKTPNILIEFLE